jgi:hypothetical protein
VVQAASELISTVSGFTVIDLITLIIKVGIPSLESVQKWIITRLKATWPHVLVLD